MPLVLLTGFRPPICEILPLDGGHFITVDDIAPPGEGIGANLSLFADTVAWHKELGLTAY